VLVIIAILSVGVISVRSFIDSAKVTTIVSEFTYYSKAINDFKQKYGYWPGDVYNPSTVFSGNAGIMLCPNDVTFSNYEDGGYFGNGKVDDSYEEDFTWLQLSASGFIKNKFDFDPCTNGGAEIFGVTRPASEADESIGYLFKGSFQLNVAMGNGDRYWGKYDNVLKIRGNISNGNEGKVIETAILRQVDKKIDGAETPYTGRFMVDSDCANASYDINNPQFESLYFPDDQEVKCAGNFLVNE
jgi:hypothetical protein